MTARQDEMMVKRTRLVLTAAIVLLLAMLVALLVVFYRLLTPTGDVAARQSTKLEWIRSIYGFGPSAEEQLEAPSSVAIAPNGDIYATDPVRARIMVFRPDGTFRKLLHTGKGGTGKGQFVRPESIDIDENGDLYIADIWAKKIIVFNEEGEYLREWPVEMQARGVSVADGLVQVLDAGKVLVFKKDGSFVKSFGSRGPKVGQIDAYQGITARDGVIYVADSFNKRLQSFQEDTGRIGWAMPSRETSSSAMRNTERTGDGSGSSSDPSHRWELPQDLVFDGRGRLIVIDAFNFDIAVVDPKTGLVETTYGEFGRYDGQFFYPTSIDYDPQRDWFAVADTQNNRVQIVRIPGSAALSASLAWRALSSPYRYLIVPGLLILAFSLAGWLTGRRMMKAKKAGEATQND